ncbi:MAG: ABC transporter ATP-binding protein, partial [Stellaceae bacterium]
MLQVSGLEAAYGESQVLFGVDFEVGGGEMVALLGRNGMGKSTTIAALMGILPPLGGNIQFNGQAIHRLPSYRIAQAGLGLVPEGRQIFPNLTVRENLVATAANRTKSPAPWRVETVLDLFPLLAPRLDSPGGLLSGGEQQM